MGAKPGERRGGRRKGSLNLRSRFLVQTTLAERKCNPFGIMADLAMDISQPAELRGRMAAQLGEYCAAKLRAVELTGADGGPIDIEAVVSGRDDLLSAIDAIIAAPGTKADSGSPPGGEGKVSPD